MTRAKIPYCVVGKLSFRTELAARMFAFRRGGAQGTYKCKRRPNHWHVTTEGRPAKSPRMTISQIKRQGWIG